VSDPHDYYVSGGTVYYKVTHTLYNTCNESSTSYDEDVTDQEATQTYQMIVDAANSGEQLYDVTANVDPTETVDPDGVRTRSAHPVWPFYRESFGGDVAEWTAFYDAVHFKDGSSWKFKSLTYLNTNLTSGVIPLCVDFTVTVNSSTNIATDKITANANVNYTVVNKFACAFGYEISRDTKTQTKTFQTSEGVF
jgi:hypothetical protein